MTAHRQLPVGTVTMLFTDIEGSTRLLQELGRDEYVRALTDHRRLLREAFTRHDGVEVEMQGDSFFFAFARAGDAVQAAAEGQRALGKHQWSSEPVRVRMGLHTGEPIVSDGLYAGLDVHRAARVMSAGHGGQVLVSQATRELLEDDVELDDLGAHRLKDLSRPVRLYQLGRAEFPPLKTLDTTNLPVAASPLIGRETELAELLALLTNGSRLVTLTGPGGTGKTRLALQAAAELVGSLSDGVFWVPLAGLRDAELVLPVISQAVGAREELAAHLRDKELLLLLDNAEHLRAAASPIAELLSSAPRLRALVTSRAPLHVSGEREFPLDPLGAAEAATLFVERSRQLGCQLEPGDTVAAICRRLDGLPLAIELASAWTRMLSTDELLRRLDRALPLLTGGPRDAPERQQTLRATIEWSYELLDEHAQQLFARLGVFAGSFSLTAAEQVCEAELEALAALVDLSLLKPIGESRFLMLATMREFALERLTAAQEADDRRRRHREWFRDFALSAAEHLRGHGQRESITQIALELDNIRAAIDDSSGTGVDLEILAALGDFWELRGHAGEAAVRLREGLERYVERTPIRAHALRVAGEVTLSSGLDDSRRFSEEGIALSRKLGLEVLAARCMNNLGISFIESDAPRAAALFSESAEIRTAHGDDLGAARARGNLAEVALRMGNHAEAERLQAETLTFFQSAGDELMVASCHAGLGDVARVRGDRARARHHYEQAMAKVAELRAMVIAANMFERLAWIAAHEGDAGRGGMLLGAADAVRDEFGFPRWTDDVEIVSETSDRLRRELGDRASAQVVDAGRRLDFDEALVLAMSKE